MSTGEGVCKAKVEGASARPSAKYGLIGKAASEGPIDKVVRFA